MNKPLQQLIGSYLALCLAFAGAVGVSPVLHQLVEHGGHGPAHTHRQTMAAVASGARSHSHGHSHGHAHGHEHFHEQVHLQADHLVRALADLWRDAVYLLAGEAAADSPAESSDQTPGHEHDSLPQLLVNGLVDQHLTVPLVGTVLVQRFFVTPVTDVLLWVRELDRQTAGRGPPSGQS